MVEKCEYTCPRIALHLKTQGHKSYEKIVLNIYFVCLVLILAWKHDSDQSQRSNGRPKLPYVSKIALHGQIWFGLLIHYVFYSLIGQKIIMVTNVSLNYKHGYSLPAQRILLMQDNVNT